MSTWPTPKAEFGEMIPVMIDDMLSEIRGQSAAVGAVIRDIQPQLEEMDPTHLIEAEQLYICGCGDSYFAGLAARYAFERFSGLATHPLEAMEFGRYVAEFVPANSLLLAISNSGKATRSVEALINGRNAGAHTIAITGNPEGWLAKEADAMLDQAVRIDGQLSSMPANMQEGAPPKRGSFGLANYLATLTTLYSLAIHIGQLRGKLSAKDAQDFRTQLEQMAEAIDTTVERCTPAVQDYVQQVKEIGNFQILGAGPSYATALFYAAKTYELARVNGEAQQLEEWAHEQYFVTGPGSQIFFLAPPGRSTSRVQELIHSANLMGGTTVVVTDGTNDQSISSADVHLPVADGVPEMFSPLVYCVPGELFATYLAQARGREAFEFDSQLQYETNMRTIQESEVFDFRASGDGDLG